MENKQDKGFTLVELLIVIVILGILATVTVFAVRGITDQGQDSACDADKQTLQTALEAYYAQYGNDLGDVATETQLVASELLVAPSGNYNILNGDVVVGGNPLVPAVPGNDGPDGIAGNADDVAPVAEIPASTSKC